jgi:hypothetical protein
MPSATRNAFVAVVVTATAMPVATRTSPGLGDKYDPFWSMRGACSGALACRKPNGHKRGTDMLNEGATTLHMLQPGYFRIKLPSSSCQENPSEAST